MRVIVKVQEVVSRKIGIPLLLMGVFKVLTASLSLLIEKKLFCRLRQLHDPIILYNSS